MDLISKGEGKLKPERLLMNFKRFFLFFSSTGSPRLVSLLESLFFYFW